MFNADMKYNENSVYGSRGIVYIKGLIDI